ncbi:hypothetical protein [Aeromonas phage AS-yj]|uniref:Uncharacterized protein n=5 Tax=Caudoviricetes TaxID=2731619 RepID=A0A291LDP0_9CAUD|nr:hypothetical protein HWB29_gp005 [Aeromonas phage AS-sw]ATI17440.1 hypothetical protein [Aeromonas phage AS-szw]ATI17654.1 hypothetical protein [Aeromonas phage AS-yj]QAX97880.1 hypothetical protein ASswx1_237 [Aeromonas phage Asswx_1]QAX99069.1 hypothetical protein assk_281 [Aeromonas phage Assk]UKM62508.1 hypothetical protein P19_0020 [Aeromonas phage P19]
MLVESLSVGVVCLGLAYGLDKFLGTGIFSWKEKTPSKLMRSNADQDSVMRNQHHQKGMIAKNVFGKFYGGKHKARVSYTEKEICVPHPVIVNFINNLYKERKQKCVTKNCK